MPLREGGNTFVFESDEGAQILVTVWGERDLYLGQVEIAGVDVAVRPDRHATWGPPMREVGEL